MEALKLEEQIEKIVQPPLESLGYRLVRVKLKGQGKNILQVMAERIDEQGMTLEDCTIISRNLSAILDVEDPISGEYDLEVSSPGIDRPLSKPDDFRKYAGNDIKLNTIIPVGGAKRFRGRLERFDGEKVYLMTFEPDIELTIDFNNISSAQLDMEAKILGKGKNNKGKKGAKNGS